MRPRPLVGVTTYNEPASWGVWREVQAALVPQAYVDALRAAGARVVLLPPERDPSAEEIADLVGRLDALVVAGGADVDPVRYGEQPHAVLQPPRRDRDDLELALVQAAVAADLPLLGVCRGMQVMAVAAGGALEQHLPDVVGHAGHCPAPGEYASHGVRTADGSRLREVLGERVDVPTYHHQGVISHPGYAATAWADDGVVEAIEMPAARFRIGVQWHPEVGTDLRLFDALVMAAS
ncbi:gamma-glutamyl-gamma-aminobutyrate hydrolase family protein [Angustibacter sp. Root456]|uniref:gamma-glutamyl-gamma-aminobutyrate hydrolase family protein n=1 Tax=Angustibacter sp. Root456 TaxID=1736539 RepID=UPI0006F3923E|nr:gamma-glutamyl-gamma-aminobutyrate hydrolase family protein [Angustibacter sp. Root456]KQX69606.1 glutamine amidotransferase [Angustibacter sp. Root456]